MSEIKKVFKWWDASESEKISTWLEEMESQGWHLLRITTNGLRFYFEKGAPRKMSYCVDYQQVLKKTDPNYLGIFIDTGWENIYSGAGWYIWRQTYQHSQAKPEIFTDTDTIMERNKRLIGLFLAAIAAQLPFILMNISKSYFPPLLIIYIPLFVLLGVCIYRLVATNRKLKAKKDIL
jgi:hypothetical protein